MNVESLNRPAAITGTATALGLPAETVADAPEFIAAALRRTASFTCPASPGRLIDAVFGALQPLHPALERQIVAEVLEALISGGDLIELTPNADRRTRMLYLGPPTCVSRRPGEYLLAGVHPAGAVVPGSSTVTATGTRRIATTAMDDGIPGFRAVDAERWVSRPASQPARNFVREYARRLSVAPRGGDNLPSEILDPTRPSRYYRGRWRPPQAGDTGMFIARRPRTYGADLWCVVDLAAGTVNRVLALPAVDAAVAAHDEAWRLQAAIDATHGAPQIVQVTEAAGASRLDFFAPLPGFAARFINLMTDAAPRARGALLSVSAGTDTVAAVTNFLQDTLWTQKGHADDKE
jgi:hypothetical protein